MDPQDGPELEAARRDPRRQVAGRYLLLRELGRGGMGVVYRAWDQQVGRFVALKLVLEQEPMALARFEREAQAVARLQHPGIVAIFDVGRWQGRPYAAMELVEGETLDLRRGPRPVAEALDIAAQVCAALEHAHGRGVVHRDLKPMNLMLAAGRIKVLDFGLARLDDRSRLTRTGAVMGTPAYMPPEQLEGKADARSDIYALGATLFALLTGRPPLDEKGSTANVLYAVLSVRPPAPSTLVPGIPPAVDALALRCLEKEPAARFQDAAALGVALEAARTAPARPAPSPSRRVAVVVGAALLVAVVAAGVGLGSRLGTSGDPDDARPGPEVSPPKEPAVEVATADPAVEVERALGAGDARLALALLERVPAAERAPASRRRQRLAALEAEARWLQGDLEAAATLAREAGPEGRLVTALGRAASGPVESAARGLEGLPDRPAVRLAQLVAAGRVGRSPAIAAALAATAGLDATPLATGLSASGDLTRVLPLLPRCDLASAAGEPLARRLMAMVVATLAPGPARATDDAAPDPRPAVRALLAAGRIDEAARLGLRDAAVARSASLADAAPVDVTGVAAWQAYERALAPMRVAILLDETRVSSPPPALLALTARCLPTPLPAQDEAAVARAREANRAFHRVHLLGPNGDERREEQVATALAAIRAEEDRTTTARGRREVASSAIELLLHADRCQSRAPAVSERVCQDDLGPEDRIHLTIWAWTLLLSGRSAEGFEMLERVLDEDPFFGDALHARAWTLAWPVAEATHQADLAVALVAARRATLDRRPGRPLTCRGGVRNAWLTVSKLAQQTGDLDLAWEACERFAEDETWSDDAHRQQKAEVARLREASRR